MNQDQISKIKEIVEEFFGKMTIAVSKIEVGLTTESLEIKKQEDIFGEKEVVNLDIKTEDPQILIGQGGQTLFEIQKLLRTVLNKRLQNNFYFNLDINDYKKKKVEYLKDLAKGLADHVSITKEEKELAPMSPYERRVVHSELASRADIITESRGDGVNRHIIIKAK